MHELMEKKKHLVHEKAQYTDEKKKNTYILFDMRNIMRFYKSFRTMEE